MFIANLQAIHGFLEDQPHLAHLVSPEMKTTQLLLNLTKSITLILHKNRNPNRKHKQKEVAVKRALEKWHNQVIPSHLLDS